MSEKIYQLRRAIEDSQQQIGRYKATVQPSPWDPRDYKYSKLLAAAVPVTLPTETDYRANLPPVFDQGPWGTCVAAATAWGPKALQEMKQGDFPSEGLSTSFLYAMCKQIDGVPNLPGTYARSAFKVLKQFGICPEKAYPYHTLTTDVNVPVPPLTPLKAAEKFRIQSYAQIASPEDTDLPARVELIKQAIAREGAIVAALLLTSNFMEVEGAEAFIPYPDGPRIGGHMICLCGYSDKRQAFLVRNTWGKGWGDEGYAWMPYDWVTETFQQSGHDIPYFMEAWTSVDVAAPGVAGKIEVTPGSSTMMVDGQAVGLDQPAIIDSTTGRTLLPIRTVAGNMGYLVQWDGNKVILTRPN